MGILLGRDKEHVCTVERAGLLDSRIRRWLQDPRRIVGPYAWPGMTAIDIGCGVGFFTVELARLAGSSGRIIAVDLQEGMLDILRTKIRGTEFEKVIDTHKCEADSLGLDGNTAADFALAFFMAHEVPDKVRFFREIHAALAPGGQLLLVEPKFHVSSKAFQATLEIAGEAGFKACCQPPKLFFSRTAVLRKR